MTVPRATRRLAVIAVLAGAVATATNPVFVRLSDLEPVASAFHRMAWALPLMWLWVFLEPARPVPARPHGWRDRALLVLCGVFFAADLVALHFSIQLTVAANSILFLNAQPIYVVAAGWLLFGERVSARFVTSAGVALLGAGIVVSQSLDLGREHVAGDALGVLAGLCYAGFILTASRLRALYSSATINAWTCLAGCPLLLLATLSAGQQVLPASTRGWLLMIGLGVVSQALGQGLIVWGLAHLRAGLSSIVLLAAPVSAALFAWWLLSEPLSVVQIGGMLIVLLGIQLAWRAAA